MLTLESPIVRFGPWLIVATLVVVALASGLSAVVENGGSRLGGDFPSFHAAGELVLDGRGAVLYDPDVQREAQAPLLDDGQFLYFAYPPYTAAAYAALAWLPYGLSFGVHTALAIAALVGSLVSIRPLVRGLFDGPVRLGVATAVALASYPIIRSVMGGQNATFTLLGFCLVARFIHDDNEVGAGLAAAAMLFKPQFGLVVILLLFIGRKWRAVAWAGIAASGLFAIGAMVTGGDWVTTWLDAVGAFGEQNLDVNGPLMIAAWGWVGNLVSDTTVAAALAGSVVILTGAPVVYAVATERWRPVPWYAIAPFVVVAAPSALYYDASVLLVTVAVMVALAGARPRAIVLIVASTWIQAPALSLGWSPMFLPIAVAAGAFAVAAMRAPIKSET